MESKQRSRKKRPCRICRKWFLPDARVGARQKTCGSPDCKRRWHAKTCAKWNQKNRAYFQEEYLRRQLARSDTASEDKPKSRADPARVYSLDMPVDVVKEVMGAQQVVIIEYIARKLIRSVREMIMVQRL